MATLHLLGLFHTIPAKEYSHCAFTSRVHKFGKMMMPFGYEVIEYSNEGSESEASEHVVILESAQFHDLKSKLKAYPPHGEANIDSDIYRAFDAKLKAELKSRVKKGDIICHPFGHTHADLGEMFPEAHHVEIGIGYPTCHFPLRVYETYQWWSWHQGKNQKAGSAYEWVCPMGYNLDEWDVNTAPKDYLLYFGRVIECKGLYVIKEIAKRTDHEIIMCGAGTPELFLDDSLPNLKYVLPVTGRDRNVLLGNAKAMLMPTIYTEPFGGAGVEGQLCGTPLLASDHGAFSETVQHGVIGFRCKTLGDWLKAIEDIDCLDRSKIAEAARARYNLHNVGKQMHSIFQQVLTLEGEGWYSLTPTSAIWE